jgi:anti-sigma regulatory factor (Ser/Thr protein kinase)
MSIEGAGQGMELSLELENTMPAYEVARDRLEALFRAGGISTDTANELELIIEEVLVNIISYAYPGDGRVFVDARVEPSAVTLVFRDHGAPFDPLDRETPDLDASIADRPIGGLGVFLTMELASTVTYERRGDANVLTVVKELDYGAHDAKENP